MIYVPVTTKLSDLTPSCGEMFYIEYSSLSLYHIKNGRLYGISMLGDVLLPVGMLLRIADEGVVKVTNNPYPDHETLLHISISKPKVMYYRSVFSGDIIKLKMTYHRISLYRFLWERMV
jgi:hypothetical protein